MSMVLPFVYHAYPGRMDIKMVPPLVKIALQDNINLWPVRRYVNRVSKEKHLRQLLPFVANAMQVNTC